MYVQVFRLRRKSHSLFDDPRIRSIPGIVSLKKSRHVVVGDLAPFEKERKVFYTVGHIFATSFLICRGIFIINRTTPSQLPEVWKG